MPLTKEVAVAYSNSICTALDGIPLVEPHTPEQILSETKGDRVLWHKWQHSLIALHESIFAGVIIGYERESEGTAQYPRNSIYLSDFAIAVDYQQQGLGRLLVEEWLEHNWQVGFAQLTGNLCFSVQTNAAEWNRHVQKLYESFGFKRIAEKQYENRTDIVYWLDAQ